MLEWYGHQCSDACGRLFEVHVCFKGSCYIPILCYPSGALLLVYSDLRINLGILVSTFIFNCYNTIHPKLNLPPSKIGVRWMNPWPLASTGRGQTNWAVPLGESGISTSKWFLYCFIFSSWLHLLELQHDSMSLQIIFSTIQLITLFSQNELWLPSNMDIQFAIAGNFFPFLPWNLVAKFDVWTFKGYICSKQNSFSFSSLLVIVCLCIWNGYCIWSSDFYSLPLLL